MLRAGAYFMRAIPAAGARIKTQRADLRAAQGRKHCRNPAGWAAKKETMARGVGTGKAPAGNA